MAKITRIFQKVFGSTSGANQLGKFGSLAAGSPEYVTTASSEDIQDLGNFDQGWYAAIVGNNSPAIQDMNGLFHLAFRQIAYLLQQGVAEYDASTEYHEGSLVLDSNGMIYQSLTDVNEGNALTDGTNWILISSRSNIKSISTSSTLDIQDEIVIVDASGGDVTVTLPAAATSKGKRYTVKKNDTSINSIILDANASEEIDNSTTFSFNTYLQSCTLVCDGTRWYLI